MPSATINGIEIYYDIIGDDGPWVAALSGGRHPVAEIEKFARAIAGRGNRVIVHDRRNCGRSAFDFDTLGTEEDIWTADLHGLLSHLNVGRAFVVGQSRSARIAIRFALRYPDRTRSLGLWGISGGATAARFLDDYYYGKYVRACEGGGMAAVCALDHFAGLVAARPANRDALLAIDPRIFMAAMNRWRAQFLTDIDLPVMGLSDQELGRITAPTAIVPYYDRMHPVRSAVHALKAIPGARLFDFDPKRHDSPVITEAEIAVDTATAAAIFCDFDLSLPPCRPTETAIWRR
jgi:pimeloyl-ACP methyl ester carboxylesterase